VAGKKESTGHHLNQACQPCVTPSPISCFDHRLTDARTAEDGSAQESSMNESAKVVLARVLARISPMKAKDVMTAGVVTVAQDASVLEAIRVMLQEISFGAPNSAPSARRRAGSSF